MNKKLLIAGSALLMIGGTELTFMQAGHAAGFNPMNMMNPSKWFGGKNRRNRDDYDYGPGYGGYGPYGAPGFGGYGPPGYGGYAPPGYGYGAPAYGYGAPSGYAAPTYSAPRSSNSSSEIKRLEDRIKRLEHSQAPAPASPPAMEKGMGGYQYPEQDYSGTGFPSSRYQGSGYKSTTPTYRPLGQ